MQYVSDLQEFLVMFAPLMLGATGIGLGALIIVIVWSAVTSLFSVGE